jgi:hypothetical protein
MPIIMLFGDAGVGKDTVGRLIKARYGFQTMAQADPIKKLAKKYFLFTDEELWGPSEARNKVVPFQDWEKRLFDVEDTDIFESVKFSYPTQGANTMYEAIAELAPAAAKRDVYDRLVDFFKALAAFATENGGLNARIVLQLLGTEVGRALDMRIWTRAAFAAADDALYAAAPGVVITDGRFRSEAMAAKKAGAKLVLIRGSGVAPKGAAGHASEAELQTIPDHWYDLIIENDKELGVELLDMYIPEVFNQLFPAAVLKPYTTLSGSSVYFVDLESRD